MKSTITFKNSSHSGTKKQGTSMFQQAVKGFASLLFMAFFMVMNVNAQSWTGTGSVSQVREFEFEASNNGILLTNGKVLVVGGYHSGSLSSCELFDPAGNSGAGSWTTTGSMATGRYDHTATLLPNGKVLVTGGFNSGNLNSCELFDPAGNSGAGSWTSTGSMSTSRTKHTATLLPNGKVLVTGGNNGGYLSSCELFDPAGNSGAGSWTNTVSMATARGYHAATLLVNGKVLVSGGFNGSYLSSCELFDPAGNSGAGSFTTTGSLTTAREYHTTTLLANGKVLITGGGNGSALSSCELFDPAGNSGAGSWTSTGSMAAARYLHTATLLTNGIVLVSGGDNINGALSSCELFNPAGNSGAGSWTNTGPLASARGDHTATLLGNGKVLVSAGISGSYVSSCELFTFVCTNVSITSATAGASPICSYATTTLTANGVAGDNAVVTWWSGTGGTGTNYGTGTTLSNAAPGTYYARVTGDCGGPIETSVTVGTAYTATPTISAGSTTTFCTGGSVTLTAAYIPASDISHFSGTDVSSPSTDQWQSFVPTASGLTTSIEVFLIQNYPISSTFNLYSGIGNTGTLLNSQSLTIPALNQGWYTVNLPNLSLTPGNNYTIEFVNAIQLGLEINYNGDGFGNYGSYYSNNYGLNPGWNIDLITNVQPILSGTFQWYNGANAIGGATNATYAATTSGAYTCIVNNGCPSNSSNEIDATVYSNATAAITGTATGCGSVTLTAAGNGSYKWSGGSSTASAVNTFTSSGTYTVTVTVTANCTATASQVVTVNAIPATPGISAGSATTFCNGGSVTLTATNPAVTDLSYTDHNTATTGTDHWQSFTPTIAGLTSSIQVYLNNPTNITTTFKLYNGTGIGGTVLNTQALTINSSGGSYTINIPNLNLTPGNPYTFEFNGGYLALSASIPATYGSYYSTDYGLNPGWNLCLITTVLPNIIGTPQWYNGANAIGGATNSTYAATTAGSYTAIVTNNTCPSSSSNAISVSVNSDPSPTITGGNSSECTGSILDAGSWTSYQWQDNSTLETNTVAATGTYSVTVHDGNGCTGVASQVVSTVNPSAIATITGTTLGCSSVSLSVAANINVPCTGFNSDVIANGNATTTNSTTNDTDGSGFVWVSKDFNPGNGLCASGANGLPVNGQITSTSGTGITYQLQSYSSNNDLRIPSTNSGTLTLVTPVFASELWLVCGGGNGGLSFNVTIHYVNGSTTSIININVNDWCNTNSTLTSEVYYRMTRSSSTSCNGNNCPYMHEIPITGLSTSSPVSYITFANGGAGYLNIYALGAALTETYVWSGGNTPTTAANTFLSSGTYTVTATSGFGCTASASQAVTVNTASLAPTSISGTTTICNGSATTLTAVGGTLGTGANYQWGTGSSVGTNPIGGATSISYTTPSISSNTTYWVEITNTTSPCAVTTGGVSQLVTVEQPSTAPTSISGTTSICAGSGTTLTAVGGTLGTGANYQWGTGSVIGTNPIGGATSISYTTPSLSSNAIYWVEITNTTSPCVVTTSGVSQLVTVNSPPVFLSCVPNQSANTLSNSCANIVTYSTTEVVTGTPTPTMSYLFSGATTGNGGGDGNSSSFSKGTTTVTLTATNTCNTATCSFNVVVSDMTPPVISSCPNSVTVNNDNGNCSAVVNFSAPTATDNCSGGSNPDPSAMVSFNGNLYYLDGTNGVALASGFQLGTNAELAAILAANPNAFQGKTYYSTVSNNCCVATADALENYGMNANCNAPGTFSANQPIFNGGGGCNGANLHYSNQLSFFVDPGGPAVTQTTGHASGYGFPIGTTTNTFMATDGSNNTSTCSFTVTVVDNQAPVIGACPSNITQCNNQVATFASPTATDNCSAVVTCSPASGSTFAIGTTTVSCTASDLAGNTSTCSFTVTVNTSPTITCTSGNITQNNDQDQCGAIVTYSASTFTGSPSPTVTYSQNSGTSFQVGTTTVTASATNSCATATCSFTVTVNDVQPPAISCNNNSTTVNNDNNNCSAVVTYTAPTATDNCGSTIAGSQTFNYSGSIVNFTVPAGVTLATILSKGARGGNSTFSPQQGGLGARIAGTFTTTPGEDLKILVGGQGIDGVGAMNLNSGGGGGSFVWRATGNSLMIVAGGGSGSGSCGLGTGQPGLATLGGSGNGGGVGTDCNGNGTGAGGAGWNSNGSTGLATALAGGGQSPLNGGAGGTAGSSIAGYTSTAGGFGGGGGGGGSCGGAGGGGGYSGGVGAGNNACGPNYGQASGGTSYNVGTNQTNTGGVNSGNGQVIISYNQSTGPVVSQTGGHVSGYAFQVGATINTFTATDSHSNTSTCSFTVTVVDNQAPVMGACPNNITQCNHTLSYSSPTATDNCSATVSCSPASGTTVNAGITTVVCTATDAAGNTATCSFTVTVVDLTIGITETDNSGSAINDGNICTGFSASMDAGVHTSYTWSNGSSAETITVSPTATSTYTVTISNGAGCTGSVSQTITVHSNPSASSSVTSPILCNGSNGVITVSGSGGTSPYTGTGTNSEPTGTYSFTVTDHYGCTATTSLNISQPTQVIFSTVVTGGSTCTSANNGSIAITASGGTGTKTYSDNNGSTYSGATLFGNLAMGTYTVKVRDGNSCLSAASNCVVARNTGVTFTTTVVNATSCTAPNGKITVLALGGNGFYNYSSNCGSTWLSSNIFTSLMHGAYSIEVKDAAGCTATCATSTINSTTGNCGGTRLENNSESSNSGALNVYPNPARDQVTIVFAADKEELYNIRLMDVTGRIVINQNETSVIGDNQFQMNISTLAKGVYMVILQNKDAVLQSKIVVQ